MTVVDETGHVYLDVTRPDGRHELIEFTDCTNNQGGNMSTTTTHKHRAETESEPLPYFGPVNPTRPNPAAHGGLRYVQTCSCKATREILCNQGEHEYGPWRDEA